MSSLGAEDHLEDHLQHMSLKMLKTTGAQQQGR